jgi:hypothetical protein
LCYAFGDADGYALIEAPDTVTAAGLAIASAVRKFETVPVMTQRETLEALKLAARVHYAAPAEPVHA